MTNTATVLCIKWGTVFSAQDVNVLYRACLANTSKQLRFVCLSDSAEGLDATIEYRPIPDCGLNETDWKRPGVWRKLSLYHKDLHDLGRVLFIDLDMAVVGSLDPFFDVNDGVVFLDTGPRWRPVPRGETPEPATGVFSFDPAQQAHVLAAFLADKDGAMANFRNEQDFVAAHVGEHALWPRGHVISFKRHLCFRNGVGLLRKPAAPPPTAGIVAFHGHPRPSETRERFIWGPAPHLHRGSVPWLEDYYERYDTSRAAIEFAPNEEAK
ncbi:hypothetical protein N9O61_02450 [Octadecabacter sp.]|nr:hypothetical protein [Octadecabacter sp.]